MTTTIKLRRGSASRWTEVDPILSEGEVGIEINPVGPEKFKIGDGVQHWSVLDYYVSASVIEDMIGDVAGSTSLFIDTVDGDQHYKIIAFDNTTVKAIPASAGTPNPPTSLTADIRLTSVTLHWVAPVGGGVNHYDVYRNGVKIGTTTGLSYRDTSIAAGSTYLYHIISVDVYGQISAPTSDLSAFINPALNVAPTVEVTTWPSPLPATGLGIIRVCGSDADAQALSYALSVDAGAIAPTDDPSIWYFTA